MSGSCETFPGKQFGPNEKASREGINQLGNPVVRVAAGAITEREMDVEAVVALIAGRIGRSRNWLINGNFDVWQRGGYIDLLSGLPTQLGLSANDEYTADRWYASEPAAGAATRAIDRHEFDADQTAVPKSPAYYLRWDQQVNETSASLSQFIEDVRTLAGQEVTLTWWMKSDKTGNVTVSLTQFFGGSPGQTRSIAATTGGTAALIGNAVWKKFEAHFTVPFLTPYAIGGERHHLGLHFALQNNLIQMIDFAQVKLEQSSVATVFEPSSYHEELERCLRYFEYTGGSMATAVASTQTLVIPINLAEITGSIDVLTDYVPKYAFKILKVEFAVSEVVTTAAKAASLNLEIGATNLTGGVITLNSANCGTLGARIAGTGITALNVGSATDAFSIEASGVTKFAEGRGYLLIEIQNLEEFSTIHPCFYFSVHKYRPPDLTLLSGYAGSGATFEPILDAGFRQITPHSEVANFFIQADAEL